MQEQKPKRTLSAFQKKFIAGAVAAFLAALGALFNADLTPLQDDFTQKIEHQIIYGEAHIVLPTSGWEAESTGTAEKK